MAEMVSVLASSSVNATLEAANVAETTDYSHPSPLIPNPITLYSIIFSAIFAFIFLFGIFTNLLVIGVFILRSEFRQYTNFFFINLSIADILVLLFCIPITITDLYSPDQWHYGQFYCQMYTFFEYCVTSVSSFTIVSISFERYYAVTKPLEVKLLFNRRNSIILLLLIWIAAILISVPFLFVPEYYYHPEYPQCYLNFKPSHTIYVTCLYVLLIFAPVVGLSFLYIYIVVKLRIHYNMFKETNTNVPLANIDPSAPPTPMTPSNNQQNQLRIHYKTSYRPGNSFTSPPTPSPGSRPVSKSVSNASFRYYKSASNGSSSDLKDNKRRAKSKTSLLGRKKSGHHTNQAGVTKPFLEPNGHSRFNDRASLNSLVAMTPETGRGNRRTLSVRSADLTNRLQRPMSITTATSERSALSRKINHTIMILMVAIMFFLCQMPMRIFLLWSYYSSSQQPHINMEHESNDTLFEALNITVYNRTAGNDIINVESYFYITLTAHCTTIIYFLHCVSNPIIYNFVSIKFRKAFISLSGFRQCEKKQSFIV